MSLGATMAWTICTNWAGVWIVRPTLVFITVASVEILSRLAILELFSVFESFTASAAPGVSPRKCKGMREYVRKLPPSPLVRDSAGARECGATSDLPLLGNLTLSAGCCGTVANLVLLLTAVDCVCLTLVLLDV